MALVRSAAGANDLDPHHPVTEIADLPKVSIGERRGETRPTGAALELGARPEQGQSTQAACVDSLSLLGEEEPAKGRFRPVLQ